MNNLRKSLFLTSVHKNLQKVERNTINRSLSTTKHPRPLVTDQFGIDIIHDPLWNKGLSFNYSERDRLGLRGLIPPGTRTIQEQLHRVINTIRSLPGDFIVFLQD